MTNTVGWIAASVLGLLVISIYVYGERCSTRAPFPSRHGMQCVVQDARELARTDHFRGSFDPDRWIAWAADGHRKDALLWIEADLGIEQPTQSASLSIHCDARFHDMELVAFLCIRGEKEKPPVYRQCVVSPQQLTKSQRFVVTLENPNPGEKLVLLCATRDSEGHGTEAKTIDRLWSFWITHKQWD